MDIKGVCYDVGRAYSGFFLTRRVFDPSLFDGRAAADTAALYGHREVTAESA